MGYFCVWNFAGWGRWPNRVERWFERKIKIFERAYSWTDRFGVACFLLFSLRTHNFCRCARFSDIYVDSVILGNSKWKFWNKRKIHGYDSNTWMPSEKKEVNESSEARSTAMIKFTDNRSLENTRITNNELISWKWTKLYRLYEKKNPSKIN